MVYGNSNLATPRSGTSRAPSPTIALWLAVPQNRCRSLRIYIALWERKQSGAEFLLRHRFVLFFTFICFFAFFCTACRLSPIEALLQALTGLCPVPFRSLRSVLNFTSCLVFTLVSYAHSSLPLITLT